MFAGSFAGTGKEGQEGLQQRRRKEQRKEAREGSDYKEGIWVPCSEKVVCSCP